MGITSFVIALVGAASLLLMVAVCRSLADVASALGVRHSSFSALLGAWGFCSVVLFIIGIVFAVGGIQQKDRRHEIAWIGLASNLLVPFMILSAVMMIGAAGGSGEMPRADWSNGTAGTAIRWIALCYTPFIAVYLFNRLRKPRRRMPEDSVDERCERCDKALPPAARFCRRCGVAHESSLGLVAA